jgi:hypothetical protein
MYEASHAMVPATPEALALAGVIVPQRIRPAAIRSIPANTDFSTPIPPSVTIDPVSLSVASVVLGICKFPFRRNIQSETVVDPEEVPVHLCSVSVDEPDHTDAARISYLADGAVVYDEPLYPYAKRLTIT